MTGRTVFDKEQVRTHIAANSRLTPFNFQTISTDFCSVKAISVKARIWRRARRDVRNSL
jgi:hypothetical protein